MNTFPILYVSEDRKFIYKPAKLRTKYNIEVLIRAVSNIEVYGGKLSSIMFGLELDIAKSSLPYHVAGMRTHFLSSAKLVTIDIYLHFLIAIIDSREQRKMNKHKSTYLSERQPSPYLRLVIQNTQLNGVNQRDSMSLKYYSPTELSKRVLSIIHTISWDYFIILHILYGSTQQFPK